MWVIGGSTQDHSWSSFIWSQPGWGSGTCIPALAPPCYSHFLYIQKKAPKEPLLWSPKFLPSRQLGCLLIPPVCLPLEHKQLLKNAQLELKKSKRKDYYKILGVDKNASEDEIKKAYRKRALMHHPDRHSGASAEVQKEEEKKFKEVGEAFTILSDPKKKTRYDSGQDLDEEGMNMGGELVWASGMKMVPVKQVFSKAPEKLPTVVTKCGYL